LVGPNGAGKTTTLRMVVGLMRPDAGTIEIDGIDALADPVAAKQITAWLSDEPMIYDKLTPFEYLEFVAGLWQVDPHAAQARVHDLLDWLDLAPHAHERCEGFSKGMRQKVLLSAALLHNPELLLLDEPFSGLDPSNAVMVKDVMVELKKAGKTILFSTHRMDQVERLCDSICLIDHGRNVLEGDLKKIKSSYGKNTVQMQYEGEPPFDHDEFIESVNNYGNYVELRLKPGADAQQLLRTACERARISRFELMEPSLEEIFIDTVKQHA